MPPAGTGGWPRGATGAAVKKSTCAHTSERRSQDRRTRLRIACGTSFGRKGDVEFLAAVLEPPRCDHPELVGHRHRAERARAFPRHPCSADLCLEEVHVESRVVGGEAGSADPTEDVRHDLRKRGRPAYIRGGEPLKRAALMSRSGSTRVVHVLDLLASWPTSGSRRLRRLGHSVAKDPSSQHRRQPSQLATST